MATFATFEGLIFGTVRQEKGQFVAGEIVSFVAGLSWLVIESRPFITVNYRGSARTSPAPFLPAMSVSVRRAACRAFASIVGPLLDPLLP